MKLKTLVVELSNGGLRFAKVYTTSLSSQHEKINLPWWENVSFSS